MASIGVEYHACKPSNIGISFASIVNFKNLNLDEKLSTKEIKPRAEE